MSDLFYSPAPSSDGDAVRPTQLAGIDHGFKPYSTKPSYVAYFDLRNRLQGIRVIAPAASAAAGGRTSTGSPAGMRPSPMAWRRR
jgi:hypothetical protein